MVRLRDMTPEERQAFDAAYSKWRQRGVIAAFLLPALPFAPIWYQMRDALGPEGAPLVVIAAQLALVLWLPDKVGWRMAMWEIRRFRG